MEIVSVEKMQEIEKQADALGLSYEEMMLNAGEGVADWVYRHLDLKPGVLGLIGSGNNGGDTLVALRRLSEKGIRTAGFLLKNRDDDPLIKEYLVQGGTIIDLMDPKMLPNFQAFLQPGVILLDGVLGTGLKLPLRGPLRDLMATIQEVVINAPGTLIIALDCPSGVDCDSGEVADTTLYADHTLTMAAIKQGLLKHPARSFVGDLHLIPIGIQNLNLGLPKSTTKMISIEYVKQQLPARPDAGHKGSFGTCLVVAGSRPFTGAAYLAGKAAYRSGCGLVNIATQQCVYDNLAGELIEAVWTVLPGKQAGYDPDGIQLLATPITGADALVIGPGWGLCDQNAIFLDKLLDILPKDLPTLFDADGLKLLSKIDHWWERLPAQSLLTPHPGEMGVLTGMAVEEIQANRWEITREFAHRWHVALILKGAVTVVGTPDGELNICPVSEPALATAGSGDVLSGMIGGLLAQGLAFKPVGILGVCLHAQAGIKARDFLGTDISVTAMDILDSIPEAFIMTKNA